MGVKLPMVDTCCGFELQKGCRVISIMMIILGVLGVVGNILSFSIFGIILSGFVLAVAVLLYIGVTKENSWFIKLYLVVEAIGILLTVIDLIVEIFSASFGAGLIWSLLFILRIYFWVVVFSFYQKMIGGTGEVGGPSTAPPTTTQNPA